MPFYNTFLVITGDTAVMTRGCTDLVNEDAYKCEVHTVGGHVSKQEPHSYMIMMTYFRPSPFVIVMETDAILTGELLLVQN